MRLYINKDWYFTENYTSDFLSDSFDFSQLSTIQIPHTNKELPFHYFDESEYQIISGYQKSIYISDEWINKTIILTFEGIAHDSQVYINGHLAASHHCGYTSFSFEINPYIQYNKLNSIVVRVDSRESLNIPPFGHVIDYMTYGGIYREVYLDIKEKYYLQDVFVTSQNHDLSIDITLNDYTELLSIRTYIKKKEELEYKFIKEFNLQNKTFKIINTISDIELWDIDHPSLYDIKVELLKDDHLIDEKIITHGFRKIEFKKDGFYLNDKKIKIRGLNRHQSYPYVGYAMPKSMQRLDADILKYELGCNAVRTSHYPQSHSFIDRCDEIGLLVFTEIPGWQHIGDADWKKQALDNVRDMILQYRNHPSIMLWGVRINESMDDDALYKATNELAHELDPTRCTGGVRNFKKSHFYEDVYTYNDFIHEGDNQGCEPKYKVTSDINKAYLVTEYNGHMFPTKSFDSEPHRTKHALRHAKVLDDVASHDDIAGSFGWCMADYNTHKDFGSGDRICYHGVLDMFRNPKMAASIYASQQDTKPILETSSSMEIGEYPASTLGTSYIFTNADKVKMYKNNQFIKEFNTHNSPYKHLKHGAIIIDDLIGDLLITEQGFTKEQSDAVKYILNSVAKYGLNHIPLNAFLKMPQLIFKYKMTIEQVTSLYTKYIGNWGENALEYRYDAYMKDKLVKSITKSPMKKTILDAKSDHNILIEDTTYDVALVQIKMINEYGNLLSYSYEPIILKTRGPIEIIGPTCISLQGGMFGTYVKTIGKEGQAELIIKDTRGNETTIHYQIKVIGE